MVLEVVHRCGFCGETFEISDNDPHWQTGREPLCPNRPPADVPTLTEADRLPTTHDHVIKAWARCRKHNTIRKHAEAPCWQCRQEQAR